MCNTTDKNTNYGEITFTPIKLCKVQCRGYIHVETFFKSPADAWDLIGNLTSKQLTFFQCIVFKVFQHMPILLKVHSSTVHMLKEGSNYFIELGAWLLTSKYLKLVSNLKTSKQTNPKINKQMKKLQTKSTQKKPTPKITPKPNPEWSNILSFVIIAS